MERGSFRASGVGTSMFWGIQHRGLKSRVGKWGQNRPGRLGEKPPTLAIRIKDRN